MAPDASPNSRSGLQRITNFAAVAHGVEGHKKVEYLGEFESIFATALDHKSGGQLGIFGETP
jgi:hypothetical protein